MKNVNQVRVTSLGSGSKGNATVIQSKQAQLLIDCGFSCKELERRLQIKGLAPEDITAVLVTHEHGDHFNGVPRFCNKYNVPVWMSKGASLDKKANGLKQVNLFNGHHDFYLDNIKISPVAVPHDSREAYQFTFEINEIKIGLLTDVGHITPFIEQRYQQCDLLMLEFNHDLGLLLNGNYPSSLKARVSENFGHLNNQQAANFLTKNITAQLKYLIVMHVSEQNNHEQLILQSIKEKNIKSNTQVIIANQKLGSDWLSF